MKTLKQIVGWTVIVAFCPVLIIGIAIVAASVFPILYMFGVIDPSEAEWSA